jgi:tetratricopeptide (TPR) repeat protein
MTLLAMLLIFVSGGSERENRRGIEAWRGGDTTKAIRHFTAAARADSTQSDYAFNAGTLKALSGQDGEADLSAALARARNDDEKSRALYNRGTSRLAKAASAPPGQGDVGGAISDLRQAVRLRPGWNEAARNLDRALRLRPPPQPKQDPKPDDKKDPKQDKKDEQKPSPGDQKQAPQPSRPDPSPGMDPQDAQRLLDGAAAREAQQQREQRRKRPEDNDDPDW